MISKKRKIKKKPFHCQSMDDFQDLIKKFLKKQDWKIYRVQKKNSNSVDIIARKKDKLIDFIEVMYQLKRYKNTTPVKVNIVRELEYLISHKNLTKAVIVTTTSLTTNSVKLIKFHRTKLAYIDAEGLEYLVSQEEQIDDLPF